MKKILSLVLVFALIAMCPIATHATSIDMQSPGAEPLELQESGEEPPSLSYPPDEEKPVLPPDFFTRNDEDGVIPIMPLAQGRASDKYYQLQSSTINPFDRFTLTLDNTSAQLSRFTSRQRVRDYIVVGDSSKYANFVNGQYTTSIPVSSQNGKYTLRAMQNDESGYAVGELSIKFNVQNNSAYFSRSVINNYNSGAIYMLNSGEITNDMYYINYFYGRGNGAVLAEMQALARSLTAGKSSDVEKVTAITSWISNNIAYDFDALNAGTYHANPYVTYTQRRGVCSGYARVATIMLNAVNIPVVSLAGFAGSSGLEQNPGLMSSNHEWNAVKVNGVWHVVDTTWDSPLQYRNGQVTSYSGVNLYSYTFPTTNYFSIDHKALSMGIYVGSPDVPNVKDGWEEESGGRRYYRDGAYVKGWQNIDGKMYYFYESGLVATGWVSLDGYMRYFGTDGACSVGWQTVDGYLRYFGMGGACYEGWQYLEGAWRLFGTGGAVYTGWHEIDGYWRYFNDRGATMPGWHTIDGYLRFFNEYGAVVTGWQVLSGKWYYFNVYGAPATGWQVVDGYQRYFEASGSMAIGWVTVDGYPRYFNEYGIMYANTTAYIDGSLYAFNEYGGFLKIS